MIIDMNIKTIDIDVTNIMYTTETDTPIQINYNNNDSQYLEFSIKELEEIVIKAKEAKLESLLLNK